MRRAILLVLVLGLLAAPTAWGKVYRNLATPYGEGKISAGVSVGSFSREFTSSGWGSSTVEWSTYGADLEIGIAPAGALGVHWGGAVLFVEGNDAWGGTGGGLSYRHSLDFPGEGIRSGLLVSHFWGYGESYYYGAWFNRTDLIYGFSKAQSSQLSLYGGGGLSYGYVGLEEYFPPNYYYYDMYSVTNLAAFGGLEYRGSPTNIIGVEVHALHEFGLGLYVDWFF